ncbi:hypothetical protein R7042_09880 [Vibrio sp. 1262-1]|uniref:hypothetical protein n=1 Tax=Vibrio sp. 1262-1 TaxID=3074548 RepID=UPI00296507E2|nr:hypothetical protein [Vibrio sp. 1262-1]MDW2402508.1 hypothetical protein [Vibrio sp. 1262-1]
MNNYIVATVKDWNIERFNNITAGLPGNWHLITEKNELTVHRLREISPRYVFFPHWSWIVPEDVLTEFECVCFHMADVPYGRGGSPLQNLIIRGHKDTKLSALRMTNELDAGPVYMKQPLSLEGAAKDIFLRCSDLTYEMIAKIVDSEPKPKKQSGEVLEFKRRTPKQSELPADVSLEKIYDIIRMLDADTYPRAFIKHGDFNIEFSNAELEGDNALTATVKLTKQ